MAKALKRMGSSIISTFESLGRARAAGELARMGYQEEAKALMLGLTSKK